MRKRMSLTLAVLAALLSLAGCAPVEETTDVEPMTLYAIKAGKADAFVFSCGGKTLILDTAEEEDGDKILQVMAALGENAAEVLLISHYDKDHVGGAPLVLESLPVGLVIDPDYEADGGAARAYEKALEKTDIRRIQPDSPIDFELGDALFTVYPTQLATNEDNDSSLIVTVRHGDLTFLFPGDAEKDRLAEWLTEHKEKYDFLKAPHHGNWNSMSKAFYLTVEPEYCVITASQKNPAEGDTLSVLNSLGTKTFLTQEGTIVFTSDGHSITVGE